MPRDQHPRERLYIMRAAQVVGREVSPCFHLHVLFHTLASLHRKNVAILNQNNQLTDFPIQATKQEVLEYLERVVSERDHLRVLLKDEQDAHKKTQAEAKQSIMDEKHRAQKLEARLGEIRMMKHYVEDQLDACREKCGELFSECRRLTFSMVVLRNELNLKEKKIKKHEEKKTKKPGE